MSTGVGQDQFDECKKLVDSSFLFPGGNSYEKEGRLFDIWDALRVKMAMSNTKMILRNHQEGNNKSTVTPLNELRGLTVEAENKRKFR